MPFKSTACLVVQIVVKKDKQLVCCCAVSAKSFNVAYSSTDEHFIALKCVIIAIICHVITMILGSPQLHQNYFRTTSMDRKTSCETDSR